LAKVKKQKAQSVCQSCSFEGICQGSYLNAGGQCTAALTSVPSLPYSLDVDKGCPVCQGRERVFYRGRWEMCVCLVRRKVTAYLSPLMANGVIGEGILDDNKTAIDNLINHKLAESKSTQGCLDFLIQASSVTPSEVMGVFAFLLLKGGITRSYFTCSLYDLTMGVVGDEGATVKGGCGLPHDVLLLTVGFAEDIPNKLYPAVLSSTIKERHWSNRRLFIFCNGKLSRMYPTVFQGLPPTMLTIDLGHKRPGKSIVRKGDKGTVIDNIRRNNEDIL